MPARIDALVIDAYDAPALARFWAVVLGREPVDPVTLAAPDARGFELRFATSVEPRTGRNQMHFDLTSDSLEHQQAIVAEALALGAHHLDVGQSGEEGHVVLADPEGNEFCVVEPGNGFLAGTGVIGALSSDGSHALGCFWAEALAWPLVWDQGEETAIQHPAGGTKISWGGPPYDAKTGRRRLHLDLVADGPLEEEVRRLEALGAARADIGQGDVDWVVMTDPDGNEFCVSQ